MNIVLENVQPGRGGHVRLLPNINRTGRVLPGTPSSSDLQANAKVDNQFPTRRLKDAELYSLMIGVSDAEFTTNPGLTLEVTLDTRLFKLLNPSGVPVPSQEESPVLIDLRNAKNVQTKSRGIQFFLEAQTFWGSPLVTPESNPTVSFRILDANGVARLTEAAFNGADLRTADVILLGDHAPAERVFMCDVTDNGPSIREFTDGARLAGVPLTIVPLELGMGDSWIQDQFQLGYTATNQAAQRIIIHLPRVASDSAIFAGTPNLRNVVDTYFPSDDIGVLKDFWQITVEVSDGTSRSTLDVAQSYVLYKQLSLAPRILQRILSLLFEADPTFRGSAPASEDLYSVRLAIEINLARLLSYRAVKADLLAKIAGAKPAVDSLSKAIHMQGERVAVDVQVGNETKTFLYSAENSHALRDLFVSLYDLHSSRNYGGNIEVSPPTGDAPYGKILAGSITSTELKDFLTSRGSLHPLVSVVTDWLEVGHIDEIAAFAPRVGGGFCVLRASPRLALDMLDGLVALQSTGLLVTRLFRGKKWIHTNSVGATDPLPPPRAYVRWLSSGAHDLTALDTPVPVTSEAAFGAAAFHDDRQFLVLNRRAEVDARYAAMISCTDLLAACKASNRAVEDLFLANTYAHSDSVAYGIYYDSEYFKESVFPRRLDKVLTAAFPDAPIYLLPVLFDHVTNFLSGQVSAVTPAAVNFQTLGKFAFVPRPYGPRMRVTDAALFMTDVLSKVAYPKTTIDERFIRSRGLDKTWHWTRSGERVNHAALGRTPTEFDADYEQARLSHQRAMLKAALTPTVLDMIAHESFFDSYVLEHAKDPLKNHPVSEPENLYRIAGYFKDGFDVFKNYPVDFCSGDTEASHPKFDQYEQDIRAVMDQISKANPRAFDKQGNVASNEWTRLVIPEDTADVFEVYTQALMESLGLTVCWIDSWYYHTHKGGIHCGTNALRTLPVS